jgi:hypothetical protein
MRSTVRAIGPAVSLVALLLGLPQGLLVVCLGADGHVAVEVAGHAESAATTPLHAEAESPFHDCSCNDGCGPCRDSRLGLDNGGAHVSVARDYGVALAPSCLPAEPARVTMAPATVSDPATPSAPPSASWPLLSRSILLLV